jgi:hypothetical protein
MNIVKEYRKLPVIIEAIQWDGTWESVPALKLFSPDVFERHDLDFKRTYLYTKTLEGEHMISPGDYLIKGIMGEFYPCKPEIFELSYELVDFKEFERDHKDDNK